MRGAFACMGIGTRMGCHGPDTAACEAAWDALAVTVARQHTRSVGVRAAGVGADDAPRDRASGQDRRHR